MLSKDQQRGMLFVISAPAGTGKSTLVSMLKKNNAEVVQSISCTTRAKRPGEKDGVDYHFLTEEVFREKVAKGEFLEHAEVFGSLYGTCRSQVEQQLQEGKDVILVIDTQGASRIRELEMPAVLIFITPPSKEELKRRLEERATEKSQELNQRLAQVEKEMAQMAIYDYQVENDELLEAYEILKSIIVAERHRIPNLKGE